MHNEPQRANDDWDAPRSSSGDAVSAADEAVREWSAMDAALSPIIGMRGVSALYRRSVTVTRSKHTALGAVHESEPGAAPTFREDFRESLARMVTALASTGVTVLMTSELEDRYTDLRFSPYGTAFLTDAIIVQRYIEVDSRLQRVMAVVKVRASAHSNGLHLFTIDDSGIVLGEMLTEYEGLLGGRPTRRDTLLDQALSSADA